MLKRDGERITYLQVLQRTALRECELGREIGEAGDAGGRSRVPQVVSPELRIDEQPLQQPLERLVTVDRAARSAEREVLLSRTPAGGALEGSPAGRAPGSP